LVIGIRLFNKEIGKGTLIIYILVNNKIGGSSFASLKDLTEHEASNILEDVKNEALDIVTSCEEFTIFF
jgi:hypothetical protein